jgi:CRP-like cAMP-binding protein
MQASSLASVPLFRTLAEPALQELASALRHRRYARGEVVFLRGDPGVNLCIVETGRVKLTLTSEQQGREAVIALMGPGEVFGELALLDGTPRSADAIAVEPTQLQLLGRDDFVRFLHAHPEVAIALLEELARRLRRDVEVLQDATFLDVPARLARVVLRLAERQPDDSLCTPSTTQSNLAAMALTTRETLNKWLGYFQDQNLLRWEHGRVRVLNREGLEKRIY